MRALLLLGCVMSSDIQKQMVRALVRVGRQRPSQDELDVRTARALLMAFAMSAKARSDIAYYSSMRM